MNMHIPSQQIVRSRQGQALSEDQLRRVVPSIFAEHAHESRSHRYLYIPTIDVVRGLADNGFQVVEARQGRTRDASKREYTKHLLRFRHESLELRVGDTVAEAVLLNSHDGSSAYKLMSGLLKLLCLNGMTIPAGPQSEVNVRHTGKVIEGVVEGTKIVLENAVQNLEKPKLWSKMDLNDRQRDAFAEGARVLRFGDAEGNVDTPIEARQLLHPRRPQDAGHDLWSTFNVVQENVIRGGLSAPRIVNGRTRLATSREIRGIDQDVKLNRALWVLAEKLAESV